MVKKHTYRKKKCDLWEFLGREPVTEEASKGLRTAETALARAKANEAALSARARSRSPALARALMLELEQAVRTVKVALARELAQEQSIEKLMIFGDKLAAMHKILKARKKAKV